MSSSKNPGRFAGLLYITGIVGTVCLFICLVTRPAESTDKTGIAADEADVEVKEFRLDDLERTLQTMQPGPERDYFAGVLANRTGHLEDSVRLLNGALPRIRGTQPARAAVAVEALADDYGKQFQYDNAARSYDDLLAHFSGQLAGRWLQSTKDDSGVMHLLRGVPAQTITWQGPVHLETKRDAIGSLVAELEVNGVRKRCLLDTGANFSVVSRSFAQQLGLKPLPGFGQTTSGVTGIENPLQVAVLPGLPIGGATLHNVILLVLEDANLTVGLGKQAYPINAIIGYPVFQALRVITFLHEGVFEAGDAARRSAKGTRMYMKLLTPVIECAVEGSNLPFTFDTGASGTTLSVRYYRRFCAEAASWKKGKLQSGGAGGIVRRKIYVQPRLELAVGDHTAALQRVPILIDGMGSDID